MAWSVDRLGRSLQDLVGFLSEIHAAGVDLFLHQQGIDTTTPGGKAMFQMSLLFAPEMPWSRPQFDALHGSAGLLTSFADVLLLRPADAFLLRR